MESAAEGDVLGFAGGVEGFRVGGEKGEGFVRIAFVFGEMEGDASNEMPRVLAGGEPRGEAVREDGAGGLEMKVEFRNLKVKEL